MKTLLIAASFFAVCTFAAAASAGDPTGTWKWITHSPNGDIDTTLKLEMKDGKLVGAYSNQFGDTSISNALLDGDVIRFEVVRDLGGNKYVVKYHGRLQGDAIKGMIEAPGHDGGEGMKIDWTAKRESKGKS